MRIRARPLLGHTPKYDSRYHRADSADCPLVRVGVGLVRPNDAGIEADSNQRYAHAAAKHPYHRL